MATKKKSNVESERKAFEAALEQLVKTMPQYETRWDHTKNNYNTKLTFPSGNKSDSESLSDTLTTLLDMRDELFQYVNLNEFFEKTKGLFKGVKKANRPENTIGLVAEIARKDKQLSVDLLESLSKKQQADGGCPESSNEFLEELLNLVKALPEPAVKAAKKSTK